MYNLETIFILLFFVAVLLIGMAQKLRLPYPVMLVLGGTLMGFTPGLPDVNFDPDTILLIVLPPVLYYAAFGIAFREFQKNWKTIFSLALGLVILTTIVTAIVFKYLFPQFSWALAFAFGAIVSPPDAIAATTIFKRFSISPRLVAILEGESLINDASAVVLYKFAVAALLAGSFSIHEAGIELIRVVIGGIFLGFIFGFSFQLFSKHYLDPVLGVVFSFCIPYITYITANLLGVSGVLAVVVNGLIGSRILITHNSSLRRVIGYATWDIFIILLNCFVFILIGLQLKTLTNTMSSEQIILYTGYGFLIAFTMMCVRLLWVFANASLSYMKALTNLKTTVFKRKILYDAAILGWSGMRGIVSLAIAISLPYTLPDGITIKGRNEVIFITFVVILITLLIPGLSISALIRWLNIGHHSKKEDEKRIRNELAKVIDEKLNHLHLSQSINHTEFDLLKTYFISHHRILEIYHTEENKLQNVEIARLQVIQSQRKRILEMWNGQEIDDKLFINLENELDMVEVHIARAELK
jgi:Na+/H+ antiporter